MRKPAPYQCDYTGCTKERTENNHWWAIRSGFEGEFTVFPWSTAIDAGYLDNERTKHYCGQAHASQAINQLMEK